MILAVRAGGRCEFAGCNRYVFQHHLTLTEGNFGQAAHIVAFSTAGPRGRDRTRKAKINELPNLMLLCPPCHKEIDDNPDSYPVTALRKYKAAHERRIHTLTGVGPELRSFIIQLRARIGGQHVDIPAPHVREAIAPRYATDRHGHVIDLSGFDSESPEFYSLAQRRIERDVAQCFGAFDTVEAPHFSVFALAPIPLLVFFGRTLGDKVAVDLFQRHRDTQSWRWKSGGQTARYSWQALQQPQHPRSIALVLSLSGRVQPSSWPSQIDRSSAVYELSLDSAEPNREFLRTREDLAAFGRAYASVLAAILERHPGCAEIELLAAVPAPVAIACGRELLPKVHPALRVYDNVSGAFRYCLTVNTPVAPE